MKQVIRIRGPRVTILYTEKINLRSNVEWNVEEQGWVAVLADGTRLPGVYNRREDAIAAEIVEINARLSSPTPPEVVTFEGKDSAVLFDPV